jgi:protein SSD1
VDDPQVQLKAILADNNVPKQSFPESVMRSVIGTTPNTNMSTYDEVIKRQIQNNKRRDLRDVQSVSFHYHGNNSKIKENVLSVVHHGDDTYEVGLHVVDITAFIDVDSTLDKEARSRGVEIYSHLSADEVVPIWPRQLCEDHLSFEQGRDCLAFSVIWKFKDSEIVDTWFGKTVIK